MSKEIVPNMGGGNGSNLLETSVSNPYTFNLDSNNNISCSIKQNEPVYTDKLTFINLLISNIQRFNTTYELFDIVPSPYINGTLKKLEEGSDLTNQVIDSFRTVRVDISNTNLILTITLFEDKLLSALKCGSIELSKPSNICLNTGQVRITNASSDIYGLTLFSSGRPIPITKASYSNGTLIYTCNILGEQYSYLYDNFFDKSNSGVQGTYKSPGIITVTVKI